MHPMAQSIWAEGVKGFVAPGNRASGSISVKNGRQPRKIGKPPYKALAICDPSFALLNTSWIFAFSESPPVSF